MKEDVTEARKSADPLSDPRRLAALRELHLPGTRATETFDRLARLAAHLLEAPVALVSLVEEEVQIFYGSHGLPEDLARALDIPPRRGFCRYVIESAEPFAVPDIRLHPELTEQEELRAWGIVSYLGVPLADEAGLVLGTFAVLDTRPREWSPADVEHLRDLAASAWTEIQLRQELVERRAAEIERRRAEEQSVRILESITDAFFALDPEWCFAYVNRAAEVVLRRPRHELLGTSLWEAFPEVVGSRFQGEYERAVATGVSTTFECFYPPLKSWYLVHAYPGAAGLSVYFHDVTARKEADLRLAAAEEHYRRLVRTMPQAVYVVDARGVFTEVNAALEGMLERPREELLGAHYSTVIAAESRDEVDRAFADLISGRSESIEFECWVDTWTGGKLLLSVSATPIREGTEIAGLHGVARDITNERERESLRRILAAALDRLGEGVCLLTRAGEFVYCNQAYRQIFGLEGAQGMPATLFDLGGDAEVQESQRRSMAAALRDGRWSGRVWRRRVDDGREFPVDVVLGRVAAGSDGSELLFGIARDVSDDLQREQQLRWVERLASIGTLVGGVAHELNNPLNAVLNFAQLLAMDEPDGERREDLVTIQREAERMAKIVADLKQIARTAMEEKLEKVPVDLNEVVTHVLRVQGYRLRTSNIEVRQDLATDLPHVLADRSQMEQVLLNLVVNAVQAMAGAAGEGRLLVRTRHTARGVALHVVDDGPGIEPAHLPRLFDPFFTTKDPGEGTGLGLSLVHGIVTEHGGEVRVESRVGAGTAFRVELPACGKAAPAGAQKEESAPPAALRILMVDDEAAIRRVVVRHLSRRGHLVDEAADGAAALSLVAANEYDVILSDLRMPGMGGEALLDQLRRQETSARMIFMTGDAGGAGQVEKERVPVLLKPVKLEEVTRAVEDG